MLKKHQINESAKQAPRRPARNTTGSPGQPKKDHRIEFGQELRRRRQEMNLTLEQLADRANITANYIGAIERGRRDPSMSTIQQLAHGLGIPSGALLGSEPSFRADTIEFARLFDRAPPEIQEGQLLILRVAAKRGPA